MKQSSLTTEAAEAVAIRAVEFLATDEDRLGGFIVATGISPGDLGSRLQEFDFLCGVLDHIMADESLLFIFCEFAGIAPEHPAVARYILGGGHHGETIQ